MNGFDKLQSKNKDFLDNVVACPPKDATSREIAAGVARGERLRAEAIARFGHQAGLTVSSLWRRPGRLTPAAAR